jgi:hypothetical protein
MRILNLAIYKPIRAIATPTAHAILACIIHEDNKRKRFGYACLPGRIVKEQDTKKVGTKTSKMAEMA